MFEKSQARLRLTEFCRRFEVEAVGGPRAPFHGFRLGRVNFLYRKACGSSVSGYPRWTWKEPMGKPKHRQHVQSVLLHGPKYKDFPERFFLIPLHKLNEKRPSHPRLEKELNISADPIRPTGEITPFVYGYELAENALRLYLDALRGNTGT